MKIDLVKITEKFKNIYILGRRPIQDWQRIFFVSVSIVIGIFIWSYFFYFSVQSQFKSDLSKVSKVAPIKDKEAEIRDIVEKYKLKDQLFYSTSTSI